MIETLQKKKIKNKIRVKKKREVTEKITHQVIQIKRVSKVVKGGKKLSFRAVVVVGVNSIKGLVGIGVGKADDVTNAINKAISKGKKNLIQIPITNHIISSKDYLLEYIILFYRRTSRVVFISNLFESLR